MNTQMQMDMGQGADQTSAAAGGGGGGTDPAEAMADYESLLIPTDDRVTIVSGRVSSIADAGQVSTNWTQGNSDLRPTWVEDAGGGRPGLNYTPNAGSMCQLARTSTDITTYYTTTTAFAVAVVEPIGGMSTETRFVFRHGTGGFTLRRVGSVFRATWYDGADKSVDSPTISLDTRYIVAVRYSGGKIGISLNGGAWSETAAGANTVTGTRDFSYGFNSEANPTNSLRMQLMALKTSYPGDSEYSSLVSNLAAWFGISV